MPASNIDSLLKRINELSPEERVLLHKRAVDPNTPESTGPFHRTVVGGRVYIFRRIDRDRKASFGTPTRLLELLGAGCVSQTPPPQTSHPGCGICITDVPTPGVIAVHLVAGIAAFAAAIAFSSILALPATDSAPTAISGKSTFSAENAVENAHLQLVSDTKEASTEDLPDLALVDWLVQPQTGMRQPFQKYGDAIRWTLLHNTASITRTDSNVTITAKDPAVLAATFQEREGPVTFFQYGGVDVTITARAITYRPSQP